MSTQDFNSIYGRLKQILKPYEGEMIVNADGPTDYSLNTPVSTKTNRDYFFGAVQIKKNYVSYHLMPVYVFPELLEGISDKLRKRMQGKSCFNFKQMDEELFAELTELTRKGAGKFREELLSRGK